MLDRILRHALFIRRFEEELLRLFVDGTLSGTVHTCVGQELCAVAVAAAASPEDVVCSNHRGHGHYLAFHANAEGLMAEIMGRTTGVCAGAGGSQHLHDRHFYSNGIVGGMSPVAVGMALARRLANDAGIGIVFHGDGAFGEGVVYESLNLAAIWRLPVLWVVEVNGYAQSTDCKQTLAGSFQERACAFGIPHFSGDTWNYERLLVVAKGAVDHVRATGAPAMLEIRTYRLAAHSKGDDNRQEEEVSAYRERDPLNRLCRSDPERFARWDGEIQQEVTGIVTRCRAAPVTTYRPDWEPRVPLSPVTWEAARPAPTGERFSTLLYRCFDRLLAEDPRVVMIGEDIEGPYGGAFKVTRDLSQRYPGRVINTPISEAALVGAGAGAALSGRRPIVEIMFGDFLSLTFDQFIQHACKFGMMYGGNVQVPLIVRTPMGGRRGYGPTHSQSIEGHFLGIPGLMVLALNVRTPPESIYRALVAEGRRPALVIENKILYTRHLRCSQPAGFDVFTSHEDFPVTRISPRGKAPQVTVVCYGGMLEVAEDAALAAFSDDEVVSEIICLVRLAPLDLSPILESARRSGRVLVIEEGKTFAAFGSEVLAMLTEHRAGVRCRRLGNDQYLPSCAEAENQLLPGTAQVQAAIVRLAHEG